MLLKTTIPRGVATWRRPKAATRGLAVRMSSTASPRGALVDAEWLKDVLDKNDRHIVVLDTAWYLPVQGRNALADFRNERLPAARFFDIDGIADPRPDLPHMLPSETAFARAVDALGIFNDTTVVLYDHLGIFSAPRVWWTFKVFGHNKVYVLDGGLPAWKAAGFPLDERPVMDESIATPTRAAQAGKFEPNYKAKLDTSKVRALQDMLANISSKTEAVIDARSYGRFTGTEPEPRPGLRGGHIPGSKSVPFPTVLVGGATYKPVEELAKVFEAAGVDPKAPLVASCGSGLTAGVLALGVYQLTGNVIPIYDGSWIEWGGNPDVPVATDPAE